MITPERPSLERRVLTALDGSAGIPRIPVVLVTSSLENEGKTYVSSCLAVALAQAGQRVLLISGDLRRPAASWRRSFARSSRGR